MVTVPSTTSRATGLTVTDVEEMLSRPLLDLVFEAATIHREHHEPLEMQCSQLLSIKTGGCPEDCGYCSQSAHFKTPVEREPLLDVNAVIDAAKQAKANGADRFCMGAAWREVRDGAEFDRVVSMVEGVKSLGLETCVTLGMLKPEQAKRLKNAGLDFYNHNLDTGRSHYGNVVTTRSYDDRLATLDAVRSAGLNVCCGGILGLGESKHARAELLWQLASLSPQPESVPINALVHVPGTPLESTQEVDWADLVRMVAAARILMPKSKVRLSAGRTGLSEEAQTLCFLAGANSFFIGDELLTTPNPTPSTDASLLKKLGMHPVARDGSHHCEHSS